MNEGKAIDFCLLIPCHNNFEGLIRSVKSVRYHTGKFLILIVDDGSDERFSESDIENELGETIPVKVLRNDKNLGITDALNIGLRWIDENVNTDYIARLDCGDTCHPQRFFLQTEYLNRHPETGLVGSWCVFKDKKNGSAFYYKSANHHSSILRQMYFRNVFIHPTIIFRQSLLNKTGYYPKEYSLAEDYAFCWQLIDCDQSFVLPEFLVTCEINRQGISYKKYRKQLIARWKVVNHYGSSRFLKIAGFLRLILLFVIPKHLVLWFKKKSLGSP